MITIRLMGGLGNQLFQLTAMHYLRETHRRTVRCDTSWYGAQRAGDTPRALEIEELLDPPDAYRLPASLARIAYSHRNPRVFREAGAGDDLLHRLPLDWAWAVGYYQRARYPIEMRDQLSKRILPMLEGKRPPADRIDVIGLHVRLGDYVDVSATQAHHGLTAVSYFAEAVHQIRAEVGPLPVRVFTDSPELFRTTYLEHLPGDTEISDSRGSWRTLGELSTCAAIVMSNSSFSWWAAFIATRLQGREVPVVMPMPWFASRSAADELLHVPGWRRLARPLDIR